MGSAAKQGGKEEWLVFYYIHLRAKDFSSWETGTKGDEQTVIKNVPTAQGKKSIQTLH